MTRIIESPPLLGLNDVTPPSPALRIYARVASELLDLAGSHPKTHRWGSLKGTPNERTI
jgi:hypothetical protein